MLKLCMTATSTISTASLAVAVSSPLLSSVLSDCLCLLSCFNTPQLPGSPRLWRRWMRCWIITLHSSVRWTPTHQPISPGHAIMRQSSKGPYHIQYNTYSGVSPSRPIVIYNYITFTLTGTCVGKFCLRALQSAISTSRVCNSLALGSCNVGYLVLLHQHQTSCIEKGAGGG